MSTSPRACARPSIDSASTGATMPGKSVTMSMRTTRPLQLEQAVGRPDHHTARRHVDLEHDLGDRRDQTLAGAVAHHPQVLRGRLLDTDHAPDVSAVLRRYAAALELPRIELALRQRQRLGLRQ